MSETIIIVAPLRVSQSKKKDFILNLNVYRNAHYLTLNKVKARYKEAISDQIKSLPVFDKVRLVYTVYPATRRLCDISNVLCIHDKFFCDALVEFDKLPDDNYNYLANVQYRMGEVDKENPRVEIEIKALSSNQT